MLCGGGGRSTRLPLLALQRGALLLLLLLQPPPRLLQLGEGVGRRVGRHGGVLDEGVRGLHVVVAELRAHPRVHGARSLHRARPRRLVVLLGARDTPERGGEEGDSKDNRVTNTAQLIYTNTTPFSILYLQTVI